MKVWKHAIAALFTANLCIKSASATPGDKIGIGVRSAIENAGSANVVIALSEPSDTCTVLFSSILNVSYFPFWDYSFSACSGKITSTTGLDFIAGISNVVKIDLDGTEQAFGESGMRSRQLLGNSVPFLGAEARHQLGNKGAGVTVAVLDTGIDDFPRVNVVHEACFSRAEKCLGGGEKFWLDAEDNISGHGTQVAGIIASSDGVNESGGIRQGGMAPEANVVVIKVLFDSVLRIGHVSDILAAMDYILRNPNNVAALDDVTILNMSFGSTNLFSNSCDDFDANTMAYSAATQALWDKNVLSIAAVGNAGNTNAISRPACINNVVAVGSSDYNNELATTTNSNALVDVFAPGIAIASSGFNGSTMISSGTSMASA